jgi:hypothetical protein
MYRVGLQVRSAELHVLLEEKKTMVHLPNTMKQLMLPSDKTRLQTGETELVVQELFRTH